MIIHVWEGNLEFRKITGNENYRPAPQQNEKDNHRFYFPGKACVRRKPFQTARLNEGARLIYLLNKGLVENKNGQKDDVSTLSIW